MKKRDEIKDVFVGMVVDLPEHEVTALRPTVQGQARAKALADVAGGLYFEHGAALWKSLSELYPELEDWNYTIDHLKDRLIVTSKRDKHDRLRRRAMDKYTDGIDSD